MTKSVDRIGQTTSADRIRRKMDLFKRTLQKGKLNASDWKLHDELLDYYIYLKRTASGVFTIPARSRTTLPLETYCLNSGRAAPFEHEVYCWQKSKPDIKYYTDLLALRRKGEIHQSDLQEILWNLGNQTRWDDYPDRLRAILQKVDPKASVTLPSQAKEELTNFVKDSLLGIPGVSDATNAYNFVKGQYYTYADYKKSIENLASKFDPSDYDDLTPIPGRELYSQSTSDSYSAQNVTFYNPTSEPQQIDLTDYYLVPEREDVQSIGINPRIEDPALLSDLEKLLFESMARLGLGFTPVLGDAADLYEMVYGKDFVSGRTLSFDERLASAVGIALGSGFAYRQAKRWANAPAEYLPKFEAELADVTSKAVVRADYSQSRNILESGAVSVRSLEKGIDYKGTQELAQFLKDSHVPRVERSRTIQSFEPSTVRRRVLSEDQTVYRWHNADQEVRQIGRFVTPDRIVDRTVGRGKLALPDDNHMNYLDSFDLKKGAVVFEGEIAPNFGHSGGGRQILIMGDPKEYLHFIQRIK